MFVGAAIGCGVATGSFSAGATATGGGATIGSGLAKLNISVAVTGNSRATICIGSIVRGATTTAGSASTCRSAAL